MEFEQEYNPENLVGNLSYLEEQMKLVGKLLGGRGKIGGPSPVGLRAKSVAVEISMVKAELVDGPARNYATDRGGEFANQTKDAFEIVSQLEEGRTDKHHFPRAVRVEAAQLYTRLIKAHVRRYRKDLSQ